MKENRLHQTWNRWVMMAASLLISALLWAAMARATAQPSQAQSLLIPPEPAAEDCDAPTFVNDLTATFTIARQSCRYGTETLSMTRVTDMRDGTFYEDKENYEMRALDIYRAHDANGTLENRPVIFFIHGGGWTDGYRSMFDLVANAFTGELGWVTVVIDYRLTSDQVFLADEYCPDRATCATNESSRTKAAWYPDNLHDVAAAFQWTVDQIEVHGGDADKIFVFGHSAGAHLASLLATHSDYAQTLRPEMQGIISMSGAYWLKDLNKTAWSDSVNQTFEGGFSDTGALDEASPATYVLSDTVLPPFCVLYAETELPSLTNQNIAFINLLQSHDLSLTYDRLEGYGHVSELTSTAILSETPTALIVDFVTGILRSHKIYLPLIQKS